MKNVPAERDIVAETAGVVALMQKDVRRRQVSMGKQLTGKVVISY